MLVKCSTLKIMMQEFEFKNFDILFKFKVGSSEL